MTDDSKKEKNLPIYKVKVGQIDGCVFEHKEVKDGKDIVRHSIKVNKTYKDKDDNWQKTEFLNINDVPSAIICLQKCYEHVKVKIDEVTQKE